nr:2-C-methyl-D-erythritol 4-phosphate cytidylyltransferase [Paraneptunicella aestuarii]
MGANCPKQYLPLAGKTLLECTLERLISHNQINHIVLAISPEDEYFPQLPIANADWLTVVKGGKERADSVLAGLEALNAEYNESSDWVLVHDAARPCITHSDLDKLLALYETGIGGILSMPVRDTMKRASAEHPNLVSHSEARAHLWHALTPQFFPRQALHDALKKALVQGLSITDEASAIELMGGSVKLVEGLTSNIKVTHPEDLGLAEFYLQHHSSRTQMEKPA